MKKFALILSLLSLVGCFENVFGPTTVPSPSPAEVLPSPSPVPPVFAQVSISAFKNGAKINAWHPGDNIELRGDVVCFDGMSQVTPCPFISEWNWQNFSDPNAECFLFDQVQSRRPHVTCQEAGLFLVMTSPLDIDGKSIGVSQLFVAIVE